MKIRAIRVSWPQTLRCVFGLNPQPFALIQNVVALLACIFVIPESRANPAGGSVAQGSASFNTQGSHLTIQTSDRAFINWQSFNIGLGETTSFVQPSSASLVWNQIHDQNPSQILGNLNANGYVVLQNSSGFFIGGQASITAHGLLMTTAPIPMPDLSSSGAWSFNAPPPTASIINYGQITLGHGGSAFLLAHEIENHGTISAPEGDIGLYAGKQVLFSERADGRGLSAKVTLPDGSVDNSGKLIADAGTIAMHAQVVNQGGLIQANSIREVNGTIELVASDSVKLGPNSVVQAMGDAQGISPGGSVVIKSDNAFADQPGSAVNVAGGAQGGNGGQVEISASKMSGIDSQITGKATQGFTSGKLFIDPANILLTDHGDAGPSSGKVNPDDPPSSGSADTLTLDVNTFNSLINQNALSQISLQATKNIEFGTQWILPGLPDPRAGSLTLNAGNNIILDDGAGLDAGRNWTVNLFAGPRNPVSKPASGTDGIYLNGSSYIQTQNGGLNLWAANDVLVATGPSFVVGNNGIRTLDGGNISVIAQFGNINAGSNPQGFVFDSTTSYYTASRFLGGISTVAGGDVSITAVNGDVISYLPVSSSGPSATADAGTGAFGPEPGNVTITAGGSVYGHYVLANGIGKITAQQNAGGLVASKNIALSLIKGSWTVRATQGSIFIQEVRNPNGDFNDLSSRRGRAPGYHLFDYAPDSSVTLDAFNAVYLTDQSVPRPNGAVPVVFPPSLSISAGAGGIVLLDDVILFPSANGELHITTKDGGGLFNDPSGGNPEPRLLMSDSSQTQWLTPGTFGELDHGTGLPSEIGNPNPVVVNISGNMENVTLITTKRSQLTVGGDMNNSAFLGENLHANDVTSVDVIGRIYNRSPYSFVILDQAIPSIPTSDLPPNASPSWDRVFSLALDPSKIATLSIPPGIQPSQLTAYALQNAALFPSNAGFTGNPGFVYNPATRRLGFSGQMSPTIAAEMGQAVTVLRYGGDGTPLVDSRGHFVTDTIHWAAHSDIESLFQASQGAPNAATPLSGIQVGGPGKLVVTAGSISLGNSYGILSRGVDTRYARLAPITPVGASVDVTIRGDLEMLTSTIAALGGGDVTVNSITGSLDLGSQELFGQPSRSPGFGIFTSGRGDVHVTAEDDIDINGSRIAAYNGGNITVESLKGNVDAGSGGASYINLFVSYVDPLTHQANTYEEAVFGSGILATTLVHPSAVPGSASAPGNITVTTPQGSIFASQGGILQEALNGNVSAGPVITLTAGTPATGELGMPGYTPGFKGNIDLGESGVIGGTVNATANGNIAGLVISRQNSTINAAQSFSGTVLSGGTANLSAGGTISGTIVGIGGVNASGGQGISAALIGQNVSIGGGAAQSTLGTTATATSTSQAAAAQSSNDAKEQVSADTSQDEEKKKKGKAPFLVRRTGRVTVILPPNS